MLFAATATGGAQSAVPASVPQLTQPADVQGGTITGTVVAGSTDAQGKPRAGTPLPGVTVTATNSLTGKKYAAATDVAGNYRLLIPRNGRYVLRTEFAAFAPVTAEVLLNATQHTGSSSFSLELASRIAARTAAAGGSDATEAAAALGLNGTQAQALRRGLQSLSAGGSDAISASEGGSNGGAALPSLGGLSDSSASGNDAVAVSGQAGQTNGLASFNEDEVRERVENAIAEARRNGGQQAEIANAVIGLIGGLAQGPGGGGGFGVGGFGGGGRGGAGGGRGSFRNFNPTQIHGNLFYGGGNGALDATQFSLTGTPIQPAYSTNRFGLNLTGSPYIPGLFKPSTKQFVFINLTGSRNENPVNLYGTVPTAAERGGDFSKFTGTVSGVPTAITIYDPLTGLPFAGNVIPQSRLSPQALALLNYYPLPNQGVTGVTDTAENYNYQRVATAGQNGTQGAARFVRNFGAAGSSPFGGGGGGRGNRQQNGPKTLRQNINANFAYSHNASDLRNFSPALDGKSLTDGLNLGAGYSVGYGRLNNNASLTWNRSHSSTTNLFTGSSVDPGAGLNIPKPQTITPGFYNGVPTIGLTNFIGLSETNPADRVQQTISYGDQLRWNHKKHNLNFGFDVRHVENNVIGGTNSVGSFSFTGYATRSPTTGTSTASTTSTSSGSSFADFLLGAPQQSKIQAGLSKLHLRETVIDAYSSDDFRVLPNLTLNYGLRYEYFAPYTETNNQLVNLDHSADFTTVAPVVAGATGQFSGKFPRSLVNPDRTLFSPRLGVAYHPKFVKNTVLRAGYGISYNTTQFGSFANSLSYQVPFAITQTNLATISSTTDPGCGTITQGGSTGKGAFTLTNAFGCSAATISNNFAVNRNYRLGRVQVINAGIQHTFGLGVLLNVDYNGSYGANLDLLRAPGITPQTLISNSQAYIFEDSVGESRFNALAVNLRKRMSKGVAGQATYTYGHSIDNASSIGGSGSNTVAQNYQRLDLEFGNSSFDVRHHLNGNFVAELPFGPNRAFLHSGGFASKALDGFNLSGDYNFATGGYSTPQYVGDVAQVATGGNYTLRPDRVFGQPIAGPGQLHNYINQAAFVRPANGFGTASRNSIELPGTVSVNMSLSRSFSFGDTKNLETRATASNVFNTVQYSGVDTVLNSSTFGQVTGVANPRRFNFQARYRF